MLWPSLVVFICVILPASVFGSLPSIVLSTTSSLSLSLFFLFAILRLFAFNYKKNAHVSPTWVLGGIFFLQLRAVAIFSWGSGWLAPEGHRAKLLLLVVWLSRVYWRVKGKMKKKTIITINCPISSTIVVYSPLFSLSFSLEPLSLLLPLSSPLLFFGLHSFLSPFHLFPRCSSSYPHHWVFSSPHPHTFSLSLTFTLTHPLPTTTYRHSFLLFSCLRLDCTFSHTHTLPPLRQFSSHHCPLSILIPGIPLLHNPSLPASALPFIF